MTKQQVVRGFFLSLLVGAFAGCAHTGGDVGGLIPAPKFLKGAIENNVYTAQDKRFTVSVPHAQGSYEYSYMQVKEQYGQVEDYISFGPAAVNQSIYRIDFVTAPAGRSLPDLDTVAPKMLEVVEQEARKSYGGTVTAGDPAKLVIGGYNAYHWQLQQMVPEGKLANVVVNLVHEIYQIDFGRSMATVWVQTQVGNPTVNALTAEQFAESLKLVDAPATTH
ncbi:MAG TPA: hypothetical protein VGO35_02110 [Gammaproteobacteria bacterium]|jgi:hypothetical protein|nr:hypothetical protein [Gammaproteobacteria bacterium]